MKHTFLWTSAALALWVTAAGRVTAQSATDYADDAASTASDAAADTSSSATTSGQSDTQSSSTQSSDSATTTSESSTSADTSSEPRLNASGQATADTSSQPSINADASATTDTSSQPSINADASATADTSAAPNLNADANANLDATADPSSTAPEAAATDINASGDVNANREVGASLQSGANITAAQRTQLQQNLTTGLQFGQATGRGLALSTVAPRSFFYNSGLRAGDILASYAGRPIRSQADFTRWVVYQPGQRVPVVVLRDGRPQTIYVTYHQHLQPMPRIERQAAYAPAAGSAYLGVTFDQRVQDRAVVARVNPGSPADRAGVRPGDAIFALNGQQVSSPQEVIQLVSTMQAGSEVEVAITRRIRLDGRPGVQQSASYSQPPTAPAPGPAVESGVYEESTTIVPAPATVVRPGYVAPNVVRPGDPDNDGRVLDGDGRVGPRGRATILPRRG